MGYFGGWFDRCVSRLVEAMLALPCRDHRVPVRRRPRPVRRADHRHHRPRLHAADRADGADGGAGRAAIWTTCPRPGCSARARPASCSARSCPTSCPPIAGRVHGPARVRGLHGGDAVVPRLRHPAAHAGLGRGHRGQLQRPAGRVLVGDAVPGARHRLAGDRGQPRSPTPSSRCSTHEPRPRRRPVVELPAASRPALDVSHMDVTYRVRGTRPARPCATSRSRSAAASRTAWWASPDPASRRWRSRWCATCRATAG